MNPQLRPRKKPHFLKKMHQPEHKFYKSEKILGKLFDQVQLVDFVPQYENTFDEKILEAYRQDSVTLGQAKEIKLSYDSELRRLMAKHAIRTEFEAWSVFVLSHNLEARDYTFAEEFGRTVGMLKSRFQDLCYEAAGVEGRHDFEKLAPFVAAMYTVTASEMNDAVRKRRRSGDSMAPEDMPLMSFPWLFVNELGKIKTGHRRAQPDAIMHQQRRPWKKHSHTASENELGGIETSQGVTHFGDVLRLDFHQGMFSDRLRCSHGRLKHHGSSLEASTELTCLVGSSDATVTEAGYDSNQQQQIITNTGSNEPDGTLLERLERLGTL